MLAVVGFVALSCGNDATSPRGTISGTVTVSETFLALSGDRIARAGAPPAASKTLPLRLGFSRLARPASSRFTPNDLIVTFRPGPLGAPSVGSRALRVLTTAAAVSVAIRTRLAPHLVPGRADLAGVSPAILAARLRVPDGAWESVAAGLRLDPAVATVERNGRVYRDALAVTPNDPVWVYQAWHYDMIDLPRAWTITTGSSSVLVAVVDDGIRFDHPDIAANLASDGYDFVSQDSLALCGGGKVDNAGDDNGYDADPTIPSSYSYNPVLDCAEGPDGLGGHGLHVAGTIGAVGNDGVGVTGVNWAVKIRPVRVLGVTGAGNDYDVIQGILYAAGLPADNGLGGMVQAPAARIINLSFGGPDSSMAQHDAIKAASAAGCLLVAAAGNDGTATPSYPASYPEVLSVSAVGPSGQLASYSSYGPTVGIAAPGGDLGPDPNDITYWVASTMWDFNANGPTYAVAIGTSMAAPHVSGVAALLLAQNPARTATQLRSLLTTYAVDAGTPGPDAQYGAGIVNARNSLTQSFAPARAVYVRLYNATTDAVVQTLHADMSGAFSFSGVANATYYVYAGTDEDADGFIGIPGRPWGAFGGSTAPTAVVVSGSNPHTASFAIGFPTEIEPNDLRTQAQALPVGGYLYGTLSSASDVDYFRVVIPQAGSYTFETSGWAGSCGFALEGDTILELYNATGTSLGSNDDIDYNANNFCSRLTLTLGPGTYYLAVTPYPNTAGRYQVAARAGS